MFICSICDETFAGIHHDSAYATQCGHVFHHQCLMTWLQRSRTCPHCRSSVLDNNLLKLFLQVDPNVRVIWNTKTDKEITTLKEQLKSVLEKETHNSNSIRFLETQINRTKNALDISNRSLNLFKTEAANQKRDNTYLSIQLKNMTLQFNEAEFDRKKFQAGFMLQQTKVKSLNRELYDLQSSNSSYIDELKLEIANLKSEKAYFQSRCHNIENISIEQPSTSKMNMENKNAISLQNQTKSKYYGHDPQLKLSTKQFLLGCVFLFVEVQIQQEDNIFNNTIISKENIIKHGGSVEQSYSARVTHIICVTQNHYLVKLGLKNGKRCVTDYWLSDIFTKKCMIPPWLAIHFPIPYSMENLPCQQLKFSIVNFGANEHHIIKAMVELVGGCLVTEITCSTDIVVSLKLEGKLVKEALAIHKPVVNVQWLNDILFGANLGIKEPGNLKYQQFDLCNPFLVNYDMVSHLMESWKTPLTFCENQQVYDLTLNPDGPTECKRQKTQAEIQEIDNDIDEHDVIITYMKNLPPQPCVMFCGFSTNDKEMLKMILFLFGGAVANHCYEATHLIMNKPVTSIEFFGCLSTVKYILNENWLKDSQSNLRLQDEKEYFIENIQDQFLGSCNVPAILENNMRHLLFKGLSFFVTPGIKYPSYHSLKQIICSAGGTIERIRRSLESIQRSAPNTYFIISCPEDHYLYNDLLGISNVVYLPEFITCSLLAQHVQLQKFLLEVTAQD